MNLHVVIIITLTLEIKQFILYMKLNKPIIKNKNPSLYTYLFPSKNKIYNINFSNKKIYIFITNKLHRFLLHIK